MPFLQKDVKTPNFHIDAQFPWVKTAAELINLMVEENIKGPVELLEKFKQYEDILNVDKKALIKELFKGEEKAPLEKLREKVTHFDKCHFEIMTLANDVVDFPLFRIMTKEMKEGLGKQADKIKQTLLEAINKYC